MSDTPRTEDDPITEDAREADDMGEKPDRGRVPDALHEALTGSDVGSDTRAGSLRGGSASGSDDDPDQDAINQALATEGMATKDSAAVKPADSDPIANTGKTPGQDGGGKSDTSGEADAASG